MHPWAKGVVAGFAAALLSGLGALAPTAGAQGLVGQCADCHTMHNSEQGAPVAKRGASGTVTGAAVPNLLRMDCVACHAQGGGERVVTMPGGSRIPQVYHTDADDLAAGNFAYISGTKGGQGTAGNRKGHNVVDVVSAEAELLAPPGFRRHSSPGNYIFDFDVTQFTCPLCQGSCRLKWDA